MTGNGQPCIAQLQSRVCSGWVLVKLRTMETVNRSKAILPVKDAQANACKPCILRYACHMPVVCGQASRPANADTLFVKHTCARMRHVPTQFLCVPGTRRSWTRCAIWTTRCLWCTSLPRSRPRSVTASRPRLSRRALPACRPAWTKLLWHRRTRPGVKSCAQLRGSVRLSFRLGKGRDG